MANRLNRNQIISQALDSLDSPVVDNKERPDGVTITGTLGVNYLQRGLDYLYKCFPIKGVLTSASITLTSGVDTVAVPADFLMDYQNGIVLANDEGRLSRRGMSSLLSRSVVTQGKPLRYAVKDSNNLLVRPVPDKTYTATLHYYRLPDALGATDIPPFPDDLVLVEFVEVAYREWLNAVPKGTAMIYAKGLVAKLQAAGHGAEPEPDQIEFDREYFGEQVGDRNDWMGEPTL